MLDGQVVQARSRDLGRALGEQLESILETRLDSTTKKNSIWGNVGLGVMQFATGERGHK